MDKELAAKIFKDGEIIEENLIRDRIWPTAIVNRWLHPGEKIIEYRGKRYVVTMPELAESRT